MKAIILAVPQPASPPAGPEDDGSGGGFLGGLLPFFLILVVLMLFMPLFSRKERSRQKRLGGVKKHDRVVTSGGIYGTVVALDDATATLEVSKGVRLTVKRSSLYDLEKPAEAKPESEPKAGAKSG